ncbi:hypothetical protein NC653_000871 [Populus alba x Populus x berolinensis]|uniref:Uncharacterized protein n=1 Tax=Populus alba x Populus x berolinensis TaxID=444605 RepID=A0AAD6RJM0_9ROSI|nr:hypothetical protein NC653_000871 [Populus alba x Populus x berolinensis]
MPAKGPSLCIFSLSLFFRSWEKVPSFLTV